MERIVNDFKKIHPDFIGLKVIYAKKNKATEHEMAVRMETFKLLQ